MTQDIPALKKPLLHIVLCAVAIAVILLVEKYTTLDVDLQNRFYEADTGQWWITPDLHTRLSPFFYRGYKVAVAVFSGLCAVGLILSFFIQRLQRLRYPLAILLASLVLVPVTVAGSKQFTNVYTPAQLTMYGGEHPYVPVLSSYPDDYIQVKKGRGFPAGHSTSGFALMSLFFCFRTKWKKWAGLFTGIALGWITGMYQTFRGEHFISHTLVSMFAAWMVIILAVMLVNALCRIGNKKPGAS